MVGRQKVEAEIINLKLKIENCLIQGLKPLFFPAHAKMGYLLLGNPLTISTTLKRSQMIILGNMA